MKNNKHIVIIGAGPAGLMAAEILAQAGHCVSVYDQMPSPARKFLIAGRGGLNITHSEPIEQFIARYGAAEKWLAPCIHHFSPQHLIKWVESLGQETFIGSSGRVFPKAMKATHLLRAWLKKLEHLNVRYFPKHRWLGLEGDALKFYHNDEIIMTVPDITILALGGGSWAKLGSDGAWTSILAEQGVDIAPLIPANCGFTVQWTEYFSEKFAGQPLKPVAISFEGRTQQGELIITRNGIEGGAVYALSSAIREHINMHKTATVFLDLRPNVSLDVLTQKIQTILNKNSHKTSLSTLLIKAGFSHLNINILRETMPKHLFVNATAHALAQHFKAIPLVFTAAATIERAISSAGGIKHTELNEHFMLNVKPNMYAIGEMLDWDAPTGGYLLQACFSMAVWVGDHLSETKL